VCKHAWLVVLALSLTASWAEAQPPACNETRAVSGIVLDETGRGRKGMGVHLSEPKNGREQVTLTGPDGRYAFDAVCPGTYQIQILGDPYPAAAGSVEVGDANVVHNLIRRRSDTLASPTGFAAISIAFFWVGLLLFRHHNIVRTNHELLMAQIDNLATRIRLESDSNSDRNAGTAVENLSQRAWAVKTDVLSKRTWWEWFFWSRGRELAAWVRLHEIERQVIAFLSPEERVVERAVYAESELRQLNKSAATSLADRIRLSLQAVVIGNQSGHVPEHGLQHLKQQLAEGLAVIYDQRDTDFAGLMEWHNKAMFLAYLALLTIAALGLVFHHEELFLVGAAGGLMSRMTRTLFREDVPSDYGASWTTLFLSPLLGAISAWIGIAVIIWLRDINVLDDAVFNQIDWHRPTDAAMIAMGFALGFSERLFTSLLSQVEGKVLEPRNAPAPAPPAPPSPFSPPPPPASNPPGGGVGNAVSREERIGAELDLSSGERAGFVGDPASKARAKLVQIVGAANVHDLTVQTVASKGQLQAVLFEGNIARDALPIAAEQVGQVLDPDGRVVFVGTITAALFDADVATQRTLADAGPALVKEAMTTVAGLSAQEPPAKLGGADPVEWMVSFFKPAPGSGE